MFAELQELLRSEAIRRHQLGSKGILRLTQKRHGSATAPLPAQVTLHVFSAFTDFSLYVKNQPCFISALITVLLSWQLHLQRGLPVQKS